MKRWIRTALALGLSLTLLGVPAGARTESSGAAHVAFDVPDSWVTTTQGDTVVVRPPAGGVVMEFHYVTTQEQATHIGEQFGRILAARIQNPTFDGPPVPLTQAGLTGGRRGGHGTVNGQTVGFFAVDLHRPTGGVIVIGFVAAAQFAANRATMGAILDSIRATP